MCPSGSLRVVCSVVFCLFVLPSPLGVLGVPSSLSPTLRGLQAVDSAVAFTSPLPLPAAGSCNATDKYTITSVDDLFANAADLECIFAGGLTPAAVPLGYGYGYVLSAANTGFWSGAMQIPYQGDYVVRTQCGGQFYNIGWLSIAGLDVGTSVWTIEKLGWEMAPGEYPEGEQDSILMDFTVDFLKLCAPEGNESPLGLIGFSPFSNSIYPISTFKDIGRVVGVDRDGATILLNKALTTAPGQGAQTVLFYAIKTFDAAARPEGFTRGTPVIVPRGPNGEEVIEYRRAGVEGVIARTIGLKWGEPFGQPV